MPALSPVWKRTPARTVARCTSGRASRRHKRYELEIIGRQAELTALAEALEVMGSETRKGWHDAGLFDLFLGVIEARPEGFLPGGEEA